MKKIVLALIVAAAVVSTGMSDLAGGPTQPGAGAMTNDTLGGPSQPGA
ncbi:hypothetical protein [Shouchella clausii]|nr:hypothetical protein [Shouchella clausii]